MASTGEVWRLGHRPALDGLRGVAVALVVLMHGQFPYLAGGGATGVAMFFTLSGFLITTLLLEEQDDRGQVSLRRFYRRRAVRLLPALVTMVLLTVTFSAVLRAGFVSRSVGVGSLLYFNNWVLATGTHLTDFLGHTWSLSIEEQFYLAWPLILLGLMRCSRRARVALVTVAVVASFALRVALWDGGAGAWRVYFGTDTRADSLLIGCLLAFWLHRRPSGVNRPGVAIGGLVVLAVSTQTYGFAVFVLVPLVAALATVAVIASTVQTGPGVPVLAWQPLTWLGRRSYGVYLWHYPVAQALRFTGCSWTIVLAVLLPATLLLTVASWRYVEKPMMQFRSRRPTAQPSVVAARVEPAPA